MADDREKGQRGPTHGSVNATIARTGPGIPDEAPSPSEDLLEASTDDDGERIAEKRAPSAKKTRFRSKVNESRRMLTANSVTIQL